MDFNDFVNKLNSVINTDTSLPPQNNTQQMPLPSASPSPSANTVDNAMPLKILIVSTHVNQINGYSKVIYNIIKQLSAVPWINVVHFGTQRITSGDIGRAYPSNVKVIDGTSLEKQKGIGFAFSELPQVINNEKPDIVFIYNDLAVIGGYIEEIRKSIQNRFFKIWAYIDMVYQAPPGGLIDTINRDVERIFCFNKGWKELLKQQGITRPVDVMNHGVDPKMFRAIPRDLARQSLGLPKDIFLFTSL